MLVCPNEMVPLQSTSPSGWNGTASILHPTQPGDRCAGTAASAATAAVACS